MRATRLVITLLAFLPSLFIIKADETELTEMRLVSDSLIYMTLIPQHYNLTLFISS